MKHIHTIILITACSALFLGCGQGKTTRPATSETYKKASGVTRLVQYNVGAFSKEIENSIPMIAAMIKELGADVVSVNELDSCNTRHSNFQLADFAAELGNWNYCFSRAMPYRDGAYGIGVAVPEDIIDSFTIHLPKGEGSEPRACCVVETKEYVFASTHLDYRSEPAMLEQASIINAALKEKYGSVKQPVFLCGDMNSTLESSVLAELAKEWTVLSCTKPSISAKNPRKCIDFILALRNGAKYEVVGSDVPTEFRDGDVTIASDHLPVFVDVRL